jgi:DnaJ-class molecular chaperone
MLIKCPECEGEGTIVCDCCEGEGVEYTHEAWYANDGSGIKGEDIAHPCSDCDGEGKKICPKCEGEEEVEDA